MTHYSQKKKTKNGLNSQLFEWVNVYHLTGYLCTAILADTIQAPYVRITPREHHANMGKNDTLFKDRDPQKPYPIPWHLPI